MATKTITITEDAYKSLASNKHRGESFSKAILRTYKKKGDISRFIGAWNDMGDEVVEGIKTHIENMRSRAGKERRKELMRHLK